MFNKRIYKNRKFILVVTLLVGFFGYAFWSAVVSREVLKVPETFWASKRESALVAEQIASSSREISDNLIKIKDFEARGEFNKALNLIREEISQISDVRSKSSNLLGELSLMTKDLENINPENARAIALDAINYQIAMVNHTITYNSGLEYILGLLTSQVLYGDDIKNPLSEKIASVNEEVKNVLELNQKFSETIKKLENY